MPASPPTIEINTPLPSKGTAEIVNGKIRYTPRAAELGQDKIRYALKRGAKSSQGVVVVDLKPAMGNPPTPPGTGSWTSLALPEVAGAVPTRLHGSQTMWYTQEQINAKKGFVRDGGKPWDRIDIITRDGEECLEQRFDPSDVIVDRNYVKDFFDVDFNNVEAVLMRYQWMCDGYRDWISTADGSREGGKGFAIAGGAGYEGPHQRYSIQSAANKAKYGNDAFAVYILHRYDGAITLLAIDSNTPQCPNENRDCNTSSSRFGHYPKQNAKPLEKNVWHTFDVLCHRSEGYKLIVDGKLQSWCDHPLVSGKLGDLKALQETDRSMSGGNSPDIKFRNKIRTTEWTRRRETFFYYKS